MQKCHCLLVTSIKEGWGLVVTEASSQGTPSIVYNVDGLRDSVKNNKTGLICEVNSPENLAENIFKLYKNKSLYNKLQNNGLNWSKKLTYNNSAKTFLNIINR